MIGSSKNNWGNYSRKCFWMQEKETQVKFNPGLSVNRPSNNWALSNNESFRKYLDIYRIYPWLRFLWKSKHPIKYLLCFSFQLKNIKYIKYITLFSLSGAISNSQWAVIFSWQFEQRYSSFWISSNVLEIPSLTNAPFENFKCLELIKGVTWQQSRFC